MPIMKGKYILMEMLRGEGVRHIFGNPGSTEAPISDALQDYPDIQYITVLQEATALHMAEGYSRYTRRPSFVSVHISAGFANVLSGLYGAYKGGVPIIVTAGQSDTRLMVHEPTLWSDMADIARHYTRWSCEVLHAENMEPVLRRAFKVARTPPTGPVFLALTRNSLDDEANAELIPSSPVYARLRPDPEGLQKAVELLCQAEKPLMLVGDRVAQSQAVEEAVLVAELLGCPVYALGYGEVDFPTSHPQYMGELATSWPNRGVKELLEGADVILAVGCSLVTQTQYTPEPLLSSRTRVVHLDSAAWEIEKRYSVAVGLWADPLMGLRELAEALETEMPATSREAASTRAAAVGQAKIQRKEAYQRRVREAWDRHPISVERLMAELAQALPPNAVVSEEAVTSRGALMASLDFQKPGDYFGTRGGGLGWGVPGPLGIKLACPHRPVVAVVGDGGAMYTIQALWTAARYNIPVTYVVCNNHSYRVLKEAMLRYLAGTGRESRFVEMDFHDKPLDLARMAESFDLLGIRVERPEEIRPALERAFGAGKAAVVDVHIEERINRQAVEADWLSWQKGQV